MRSTGTLTLVVALCALPFAAAAQDPPLPPGHPPIGDMGGGDEPGAPDGDDPHAGDAGGGDPGDPHGGHGRRVSGMGQQQTFDRTERAADLPQGTLVVRVVDPEGEPVADARVEVGMLRNGQSDRRVSKTNASGEARWNGLPTGADRACRVIVTNGPARYPAEPFAMTGATGYRVTVTRWPVTESTQGLLVFIMRTFLEFAEEGDRLKVTQHMQLMNIGQAAIAPDEGIPIPVPAGMKAFRSEQGMGDQRVVERDGKLFVEGSLPPGEVQLAYGFDLALDGRSFTYEQRLPFKVVLAEVYVERAPGMTMKVPGMADPEEMELEGRSFLKAHLARRPQSPAFPKLRIQLGGLPGPGAGRWIALGLAVIVMGLGLAAFLVGGDRREAEHAALHAEKERLIAEALRIEEQRAKGKLDASLYERVRERNLTRLAEILRLEDRG